MWHVCVDIVILVACGATRANRHTARIGRMFRRLTGGRSAVGGALGLVRRLVPRSRLGLRLRTTGAATHDEHSVCGDTAMCPSMVTCMCIFDRW